MPAPRKPHTQPRSSTAARVGQTQPRSKGTAKRLSTSDSVSGVPAAGVQASGVPALPDGYLPLTYEAWSALWSEPQARSLTGVQLVVARRWIEAFDAWLRALEVVKASPMVSGSMGQPTTNPMMAWVAAREAAMEKCEKQLGIGLRNKADLGLTVGQAQLTAQQVNEMYRRGGDERPSEDGVDEDGWSAAE